MWLVKIVDYPPFKWLYLVQVRPGNSRKLPYLARKNVLDPQDGRPALAAKMWGNQLLGSSPA